MLQNRKLSNQANCLLTTWLRYKPGMHKDEDTSSGRGAVATKSIIIALVAIEKPNNLPSDFKAMLRNSRAEMKLGEWGNVCDIHKSRGFATAGNSTVGYTTHKAK